MNKSIILQALFIFLVFTIRVKAQRNQDFKREVQLHAQTELLGSILKMEWCGTNEIFSNEFGKVKISKEIEETFDSKLFVLLTGGRVFKTRNFGKKWENLDLVFNRDVKEKTFFATEISISPVDGKTVYIWGSENISYSSDECGETWKELEHQTGLFNFRFHNTNKDWILAYYLNSTLQLEGGLKKRHFDLYASQNGGLQFSLIKQQVLEATWNRNTYFELQSKPGIIAAIEQVPNNPQIVFTDNFWETETIIQEGGNNFFQAQHFLFVTLKSKDHQTYQELKIATLFYNLKAHIELNKIELPFESDNQLSFTILANEGSKVFLSITHENQRFNKSIIYSSDWKGYQLNAILNNNVCTEGGICDFLKILSNEGVFIANIFNENQIKLLQIQENNNKNATYSNKVRNYITTVISFDNGVSWNPVKQPSFHQNEKIENFNQQNQNLNLVGTTNETNKFRVYSSANAPGIIIGIGNIGKYLTKNINELNTFLSTDGGHNWNQILQGPHIFEIGDHGGLIVAADGLNKTNIIKYSWDEGKTWNEYVLEASHFTVISITSEPNNLKSKFIVEGIYENESQQITKLIQFDLSSLHTKGCVGSKYPNNPSSDYEMWIPANFQGNKCVLGRKSKYVRRKPEAQCYNSINISEKIIVEECPCTNEDFECDFGFERKNNSSECVPINDSYSFENLQYPPPDCNYAYMISKGYRKIPGVGCNGEVDLEPELKKCPSKIIKSRREEQTEDYLNHKIQEQSIIKFIMESRKKTFLVQKQKTRQRKNNMRESLIKIFGGGVVFAILAIFLRRKIIKNFEDSKRKQKFIAKQVELEEDKDNLVKEVEEEPKDNCV